jgi:Ca2+/Na+ antiporter
MKPFIDSIAKFFGELLPNSTYPLLVALFFLVLALLAIMLLVPRFKMQRANLVLGIVIIALFLLVLAAGIPNRWEWIAALVPTLMVGYQLFYLWLYHPRETDSQGGAVAARAQTPQITTQSYRRAQETIYSHFSLKTLFTRYGLPAVLLGITGIVLADIMVNPTDFFSVMKHVTDSNIQHMLLRGIRLGALGAYVYILLELGRRIFRHDVTGAIAMWCWVTLVLGPVLAATVAFLWRTPAQGADNLWWGTGLVLFFAGFAPRRVIGAIEGAAVELLKIGPTSVVKTRITPLTQIRGIGPQIEERLGEEGIWDVNSLASAEPVRLVRNTSFDMRQILTWIDEAILMVTLPRSWEVLEEAGITGAIDLAWYSSKIVDPATGAIVNPLPQEIADLAGLAKLSSNDLVSTIQRLSRDTQVQYIWTLYNNFTEFAGGGGRSTAANTEAPVAGTA